MIIFRIIFNLFGMVTRMGVGLLALPIFILTRHIFLLVIAGLILFVYLFFSSDDQKTRQNVNTNKPTMVKDAKGRMIQVTTPVREIENGNSAFANDVYRQMTQPEQAYYSQIFYYVMASVPDNETHSWSNVDIAGTIRPANSFNNNAGDRCRMFSEVLKVHAVQQNITGMACDNGGGTWCKLAPTATPACGLGHKPSPLESIGRSFDKLF